MKSLRISLPHRPLDLASTTHASTATDQRAASAERAGLYHSARWQRARLRYLRDNPLCATCGAAGLVVAAFAVDHSEGHRTGDWRARFWDEATWQALCLACHNTKSATELAAWNRIGGSREPDGGYGVSVPIKPALWDRTPTSK